jgi:hypothetical protein
LSNVQIGGLFLISLSRLFTIVKPVSDLWDRLRQVEGLGYPPASWFVISNDALIGNSGQTFSRKEGVRPIVLARISGPIAIVYPRSASIATQFDHAAHKHEESSSHCAVTKDGWIKFSHPFTVKTSDLLDNNYSCLEPVPPPLIDAIDQALRFSND